MQTEQLETVSSSTSPLTSSTMTRLFGRELKKPVDPDKLPNILKDEDVPYENGDVVPRDENGACMLCQGNGWYTYEIDFEWFTRPCPCGCLSQIRRKSNISFAEIPEKYASTSLKDLRTNVYTGDNKAVYIRICKMIKTYLDKYDLEMKPSGKGLYLFSKKRGSGKTMMAAAIANELIDNHGERVKFATTVDIFDELKRTYNEDSKYSESRLLDALETADVLVIDDFGTERDTPWQNEKLFSIVNTRYAAHKVTIFTSNLDTKDTKTDRRITSRIEEMCYKIAFPEEDIREHIHENCMNDLTDLGG